MFRNFKDLGRNKVPFELASKKYFKSFNRFYLMRIFFDGKYIKQVISKKDYRELKNKKETEVYIRKYKKAYLNQDLAEYEFSLTETDWKSRDKRACIGGFFYIFLCFEFLAYVFIFMP